jgi:hypothetical protein|nr:MAG TPA: hypothetical protein [Caudoviricetes sp.]
MNIQKELLKLEEDFNIEKTKFDLRSKRVLDKLQATEEKEIKNNLEEAIKLYKNFNDEAEKFLE